MRRNDLIRGGVEGYRNYLNKWLNGLYDEINFWKNYMEKQGGIYNYDFKRTVQKNRKFSLESELPETDGKNEIKFADIGSGPFSRGGMATDLVKLNAIAVDPLALAYRILKNKYNLDNEITLETGFVEMLDKKFPENFFDMVHMSNSLDHSFHPVFGICQLLYICKVGGKVILRHSENEAENEKYQGLHQWNLSLHNRENSFVIWRPGRRFDICRMFEEYAEIRLIPDLEERTEKWIYNKVVMVKKKNIEIPENIFIGDMLEVTYEFLIQNILHNVYLETGNCKEIKRKLLKKKIRETESNPEEFQKMLKEKGIDSVAIYGLGEVGKELYSLLESMEIKIASVVDRRTFTYKEIKTVLPQDFKAGKDTGRIVVTVIDELEEISRILEKNGCMKEKIVSIEEFIS